MNAEDLVITFTKHTGIARLLNSVPFIIFGLFWAVDGFNLEIGMGISYAFCFLIGLIFLVALVYATVSIFKDGYRRVPLMDFAACAFLFVMGVMLASRQSDGAGVRVDAYPDFAKVMTIYLACDSFIHVLHLTLSRWVLYDDISIGAFIGACLLTVLYVACAVSLFLPNGTFTVAQIAFFVYVIGMLVGGVGNAVVGLFESIQATRS
jgi:hypothetical protein